MEHHSFGKSQNLIIKWFKVWVPQDAETTGGKSLVVKWVTESQLNAMKQTSRDLKPVEPEPEPTSEILFLCNHEGCGKTFIDAGALRKHSQTHGERQHVCHYENCGKKFVESSKLKRHFLIHTGERDFVCPHEGCGKAFSLDFNLRSHMKTHSQENYHVCSFPGCGRRYAHEYKLTNHIMSHHKKQNNNNMMVEAPTKYIPLQPVEKPFQKSTKALTGSYYTCPYKGCEKSYTHEYKLNIHLKREHHIEYPEEKTKNAPENGMDAGSDHGGHTVKLVNSKSEKQNRPKPYVKSPPAKVLKQKASSVDHALTSVVKMQPWPMVKDLYQEENSEETKEDYDNGEDQWGYVDDDESEETEYED
ncbi:hypothetical protein QVD17_35563 [Tagetes erecta]|uniref:C2H2-type domain-containing protein n=1 Tax=Tagetes erecta TaxID=13708 RepID=A0AAD8JZQ5_TARER|nr:hypothetical protein QVD17_35563 [Tagetes erecta]